MHHLGRVVFLDIATDGVQITLDEVRHISSANEFSVRVDKLDSTTIFYIIGLTGEACHHDLLYWGRVAGGDRRACSHLHLHRDGDK